MSNGKEIHFVVREDGGFERKFFNYALAKEHAKNFGGQVYKVIIKTEVLQEIGNGVWA